ncbi:MAG TPA: helix-turn-helix domain-containing protein [Bryobacteraceae bacterium]|jgi:HTH-type transcriptional regulator/antitoxin HigA|nr:helix-turn-helix domain-containing protein [Bryobacteraceae bacterium]
MGKTLTSKAPERANGAGLDPARYGRLCAKILPKVIESDEEFDRMVEHLERLTFKRDASAEENALADLLQRLIQEYDDEHYPLPEQPPHEMVKFLMEQRGLKQADLVPVLGSRAQVSDLVNGKRGISKAQVKKLAEYFGVSAELFL